MLCPQQQIKNCLALFESPLQTPHALMYETPSLLVVCAWVT